MPVWCLIWSWDSCRERYHGVLVLWSFIEFIQVRAWGSVSKLNSQDQPGPRPVRPQRHWSGQKTTGWNRDFSPSHLLLCTWVWATTDGLNLVHLWSDLASPKPLNQVLFLLFDLLTLVQCQACLLNLSQYSLQMTQVLLPDVAEDDHIIQVGSTSVFTPLQDPVHQSWEGGGCSIDAKGHHSKLKEADRCP